MRIHHTHPLGDDADRVRAAVVDVQTWPAWIPGLVSFEQRGNVVHLALQGPRVLHFELETTPVDDGVDVALVQGDAAAMSASVRVDVVDPKLVWELDVEWPVSVPQPLLVELRTEVLVRWSRALVNYVSQRGG